MKFYSDKQRRFVMGNLNSGEKINIAPFVIESKTDLSKLKKRGITFKKDKRLRKI